MAENVEEEGWIRLPDELVSQLGLSDTESEEVKGYFDFNPQPDPPGRPTASLRLHGGSVYIRLDRLAMRGLGGPDT
jgi:hypothetical protein